VGPPCRLEIKSGSYFMVMLWFDIAYMVGEILVLLNMDKAYYVLVLIMTIELWIRHVMCFSCCSRLKFYSTTTYVIHCYHFYLFLDPLLGHLHKRHVSNNI
jgi:hypothetical protein